MKSRWSRLAMLVAMGVLSMALLVACSDEDPEFEDDATTEATATEEATEEATEDATEEATEEATATEEGEEGDAGASEVEADLSEFAIDLSSSSVPAGEVTFTAENMGSLPHELVIVRSDEAPDSLPVVDAVVDESTLDVIGEIEEFPAGESDSATFDLEAGTYILFCNVAGHYGGGMHTAFTVE